MKFQLVTGRTDLVQTFVFLLFLLTYVAGTSPFEDENSRSYFPNEEEIYYAKVVKRGHDKEGGRLQSSGQVIAIGG